jgi:hypothetical protein
LGQAEVEISTLLSSFNVLVLSYCAAGVGKGMDIIQISSGISSMFLPKVEEYKRRRRVAHHPQGVQWQRAVNILL